VEKAVADIYPAGAPGEKPLILAAEDHPVNREFFSVMLKRLGYPFVMACDGIEVLEKAAALSPALIFMDIQMPRMNGLEAAAELRKRGFQNPIIAVSAVLLPEEREQCLAAGMDDLLLKPFKYHDLEGILTKWSGGGLLIPVEAPERIGRSADRDALFAPSGEGEGTAGARGAGSMAAGAGETPIFDSAELLDTFMNEGELARSMLSRFLERTGPRLEAVPGLWEGGDWETARREAHTIRGSALTLGAMALGEASRRLEAALLAGKGPEAEAAYPPVRTAFEDLRKAAEPFLAGENPRGPAPGNPENREV
jgi:CheY-like chemotaxis protein